MGLRMNTFVTVKDLLELIVIYLVLRYIYFSIGLTYEAIEDWFANLGNLDPFDDDK